MEEQLDLFDETARAVTALESARAEFSRLHNLITEADSDSLKAIDDADVAYKHWRDTAFRLRELWAK